MVPSYYLITQPFSEERAHETRRRVTPSHVSVFLLGYPPESAPDRQPDEGPPDRAPLSPLTRAPINKRKKPPSPGEAAFLAAWEAEIHSKLGT